MSLVDDPQCLQNSNLNIFWTPMTRQRMRNYLRLFLGLVLRNRRARLYIHIPIETRYKPISRTYLSIVLLALSTSSS